MRAAVFRFFQPKRKVGFQRRMCVWFSGDTTSPLQLPLCCFQEVIDLSLDGGGIDLVLGQQIVPGPTLG